MHELTCSFLTASAGSAEITENEVVLVADPTLNSASIDAIDLSNSTSIDAIDESSRAPVPTEDSILEPNEMSSRHSEGPALHGTEPLERDRTRHNNLSSYFQEELPDKSGKPLYVPRKCLFTEPNQPPCETEEPREVFCSILETFCKPQDSETLTRQHQLYSQMSQLLRLLKRINYRPEEEPPHGVLPNDYRPEEEPPHGFLPRWPQEHKRDKYVPKRRYKPHQHPSLRVPQYYASKHYDLEVPESYPHGHLSREFKGPQSRHHEYLPQDFQRRIPQHEKPSFKPHVHRMPRYMARWTDFLPQRPHSLAIRPRLSANRLQYRQPANMPQMFYYASK